MRTCRIAIACAVVLGLWCAAPALAGETGSPTPIPIAEPRLELPIPTLPSFSRVEVQGTNGTRYVDVPYVAEYIVGLYRYALGIIVTLAMVMIVVGGLRWVTAAGNAESVGKAKETISRALIGLLIAFGSYTILYVINPELVNFRALRIDIINPTAVIESYNSDATIAETESGTGRSTPATSVPGGGGSEDCIKLKQYVQQGLVTVGNPIDRSGVTSIDASGNFVIRRTHAPWCYVGVPDSVTGGRPSTFDDPADGVHISPNICKLLTDLRDGIGTRVTIACIICGHARCGLTHCTSCVQDVLSRGSAGNPAWNQYQSEHWDGYGVDITGNLNDIQRYVVDELAPRYGNIDKVIGPLGWNHAAITCNPNRPINQRCVGHAASETGCTQIGTADSGRTGSSYTLVGGRPHPYGAGDLCNHLDHIHVDFQH